MVGERHLSYSGQALMMLTIAGSSLWGRVAVGSIGWSWRLCCGQLPFWDPSDGWSLSLEVLF